MSPCGPGGQFPESMSLIQQLIGIMLVLSFGAVVLPPEPAPQPVADKTLHLLKGCCAVAVMEILAPAFELSVNRADRFFRRLVQCPVVQREPDVVPQFLTAFGVRLYDRKVPPGARTGSHDDGEAQKLEAVLPGIQQASFGLVELQAPCLQPS